MASPCDGSDQGSLSDDGSVKGRHDPSTTQDEGAGGNIEERLEAFLRLSEPLQPMEVTSDPEHLSLDSPTYSTESEAEVE